MILTPSNLITLPQAPVGVGPMPADTVAPLEVFAKNGYYIVDDKIFRNKIYAMQEATRKHLKPNDVKWVFNDNVYNKLDWKKPSGVSLLELYRMRAQQLREKYDYLILTFSGGGDSMQMLDSFVLNNIYPDEVVVHWARHQTSGKYIPNTSTDPTNLPSEWDFLVEPKLKWLEKVAPNVKITVYDNMVEMKPEEPLDDLMEITPKHTWNSTKRYRGFDDVLMARQEKHKNCAIVLGVSPPLVQRLDRHLLHVFSDGPANTYVSGYTSRGPRTVEFFYWTPDMPEIVRDQCHVILSTLRSHPEFLSLIPEWNVGKSSPRSVMLKAQHESRRRWLKSVLYPTCDWQALQVDKNNSPCHNSEWFSWIYTNPQSAEIIQPHRSAVASHQRLIDPDFFVERNGDVHDYCNYYTKPQYVGSLT